LVSQINKLSNNFFRIVFLPLKSARELFHTFLDLSEDGVTGQPGATNRVQKKLIV